MGFHKLVLWLILVGVTRGEDDFRRVTMNHKTLTGLHAVGAKPSKVHGMSFVQRGTPYDGCPLYFTVDWAGALCANLNNTGNDTQSTYRDCYERCQTDSRCESFSHNSIKKKCYRKTKDRKCDRDTAGYVSGKKSDDRSQVHACKSCQVENWQAYGECNGTCRGSYRERKRVVRYSDDILNAALIGDEEKCREIDRQICHDDITCTCHYESEGEWSSCSATCDGGVETRTQVPIKGPSDNIDLLLCTENLEYRACAERNCTFPNNEADCHNPPCHSGCNEEMGGENYKDYRGCQYVNRAGMICRNWKDTLPSEQYIHSAREGSGTGDHNYCRNAVDQRNELRLGPWCYSSDSSDMANIYISRKDPPDNFPNPKAAGGLEVINGTTLAWHYCNPTERDQALAESLGEWGPCAATCGPSFKIRQKNIETFAIGVGGSFDNIDLQACEERECPPPVIDCLMPWSSWGECNKTCSDSGAERSRETFISRAPVDSYRFTGRTEATKEIVLAAKCPEHQVESDECPDLPRCPQWYDASKPALIACAGAGVALLLLSGLAYTRVRSESKSYHQSGSEGFDDGQDDLYNYAPFPGSDEYYYQHR